MKDTISGVDAHGNPMTVKVGDSVIVYAAGHNLPFMDTVRACFVDHVLLEPMARNQSRPAVVLTTVSWAPMCNVLKVNNA